jgi:predicted Zn-dependent peptidase
MNRDQLQQCHASWFNPGNLTAMGCGNLESAGLPTDFKNWLKVVEEKTGQYAKRTAYARHWLNGCTPEEAIHLVATSQAAEECVQNVFYLSSEAARKGSPRHLQFGSAHIAESVVARSEQGS